MAEEVLGTFMQQLEQEVVSLERQGAGMVRQALRDNLKKSIEGYCEWVQTKYIDPCDAPEWRTQWKRLNSEMIPAVLQLL